MGFQKVNYTNLKNLLNSISGKTSFDKENIDGTIGVIIIFIALHKDVDIQNPMLLKGIIKATLPSMPHNINLPRIIKVLERINEAGYLNKEGKVLWDGDIGDPVAWGLLGAVAQGWIERK